MSYDDWKTNAPCLVDDGVVMVERVGACDCGQPLEGGLGGLCADCVCELAENEVVKTCTCCGRMITREEWADLPRVGSMFVPADEEGPQQDWELRNCGCGSTLMTRKEPAS